MNTALALAPTAPAILAGAAGPGPVVVPLGSVQLVDDSAPSSAPHCDASQPRGQAARYQGGSASALYDRVFHPWAGVPYLDTHVPQALATWNNWDGAGHTLVLLGMYRKQHHSFLVGVDPKSGRAIGTVEIKESHLGGMGFVGPWLFAQDNADAHEHPRVRRYRIDKLRDAMHEAVHSDRRPFLHADGPARPIDAIDFFAVEGHSVYAGNHGKPGTAKMFRYTLSHDGRLQKVEGPWRIPPEAQGMVITPKAFIFSSSRGVGRGRLSFVRRAAPGASTDPFACVWIPAMPEDMTVLDGTLVIDFESGTKRYAPDHPANRIRHFHEGILSTLLSLTHAGDPPAPHPAAAPPAQQPAAPAAQPPLLSPQPPTPQPPAQQPPAATPQSPAPAAPPAQQATPEQQPKPTPQPGPPAPQASAAPTPAQQPPAQHPPAPEPSTADPPVKPAKPSRPTPPPDTPTPLLPPGLSCRIVCVQTSGQDVGPSVFGPLPVVDAVPDLRARRARTVA